MLPPRKIKNSGRVPNGVRCPAHLAWIRGFACILHKTGECDDSRIEAMHVDYAGDKGMARKTADRHAVPACGYHHKMQHRIGWRTFEARFGIDALELANEFAARSPHRHKWDGASR